MYRRVMSLASRPRSEVTFKPSLCPKPVFVYCTVTCEALEMESPSALTWSTRTRSPMIPTVPLTLTLRTVTSEPETNRWSTVTFCSDCPSPRVVTELAGSDPLAPVVLAEGLKAQPGEAAGGDVTDVVVVVDDVARVVVDEGGRVVVLLDLVVDELGAVVVEDVDVVALVVGEVVLEALDAVAPLHGMTLLPFAKVFPLAVRGSSEEFRHRAQR